MFSLKNVKNNLSPEALTALGMGLLSGQNASQQWSNGAQALGGTVNQQREARKEAEKKNKTLEFLNGVNPQLAQAVRAGALSAGDAYGQHLKAQTPKALPSGVQEYEYAKGQGFDGSLMDYKQAMKKAGATNVNVNTASKVGTIPQGYQLVEDPQTGAYSMSPIAGGPAEIEQQKAAEQKAIGQRSKAMSGNVVIEDIDRALEGIAENPMTTTGMGASVLQNIPGTAARDVAGLVQTIKANSGFDRLQAMRDASPTGGALGAINQSEMGLLQSALGNLELSQSREQLEHNLKRVKAIYEGIVHGGETPPPQEQMGDIQSLIDQYAD